MAPKAPSSIPPVIPEGCPMKNHSNNNNNTNNNTGNNRRARGDPNKPIRVIKSTGLPVEARPKKSTKQSNVILSQQLLKQRRYETIMRWVRLLLFLVILLMFMKFTLQINYWLYHVDYYSTTT